MTPTMLSLDEYSLMHIFTFLPIIDRIRTERVCKRWQNAIKNSWSSFRYLNLSKKTWGSSIFGPDQVITKNNDFILQEVLLRCGNYVKNIKLSYYHYYNNNDDEYFDLTCLRKCPNIEIVNLKAVDKILSDQIMNMIDNCNNILELKLTNNIKMGTGPCISYPDLEKNLINLCSKNKVLESIYLKRILVSDEFLNNKFLASLNAFVLKTETNYYHNLKNYSFNLRNLKTLKISLNSWRTNDRFMEMMSNQCCNITELNLNLNEGSYECDLARLFSISKLEKLTLKNSNINGVCLLNLKNESMRTIKLIDCNNLKAFHLISMLNNLSNLTKLRFQFSTNSEQNSPLTNECLEAVSNHWKLENLYINNLSTRLVTSCNFFFIERFLFENFYSLLKLKNLKILKLWNISLVTDLFLSKLSIQLLKLSSIDITYCKNVSDEGIERLSNLPKLKFLFLRKLNITGQGLISMRNLEIFFCRNCYKIKDVFLCELVKNCVMLKFLDISGCDLRYDNEFLNFINTIASKRSKSDILTVMVMGTYSIPEEMNFSENLILIDQIRDWFYFSYKHPFDYLKLPKC